MARICCSNCEVTAPSIVQWPLLCTRGAISLTTRPVGAGEIFDGEDADVGERLGDAQSRGAGLGDLLRDGGAAGHGRSAQDAVLVHVLGAVPEGVAAVRPARQDHREFGGEVHAGLGDRGLFADRFPGGARVAGSADPGLALAVIAERRVFRTSGRPSSARAACTSSSDSTGRHGATRAPQLSMKLFSSARSWATASELEAGAKRVAEHRQRLGGQIFELVGGDVNALGEIAKRGAVIELGAGEMGGDIGGAGPLVRVEMWHL